MKKVLFALVAVLAFAACTPEAYDDSAIKEQINNLDDRLTKVEEDLATLELNVAAMKTLAEALKTGKYIVSYVALEDESGYTITFNDGTSIVVKHGEKGEQGETGATGETGAAGSAGKDGETPTITVKENTEGVLCWYINGEEVCPVYEGTPVFSSVDGNLYVTYPGETEAQWIGALTGKSIFDSVVVDEENGVVIFTFVGENGQPGDSFTLPLAAKFELVIDTKVGLVDGATSVEIPYEVKGRCRHPTDSSWCAGDPACRFGKSFLRKSHRMHPRKCQSPENQCPRCLSPAHKRCRGMPPRPRRRYTGPPCRRLRNT